MVFSHVEEMPIQNRSEHQITLHNIKIIPSLMQRHKIPLQHLTKGLRNQRTASQHGMKFVKLMLGGAPNKSCENSIGLQVWRLLNLTLVSSVCDDGGSARRGTFAVFSVGNHN